MLSEKITDGNFNPCEVTYIPIVTRYASRGVLTNHKNDVAMIYMSQNGFYKLPGGGIEGNETKEIAFMREIKEETGYVCEIIQELGYIEEHKNRTNFCQHSYCFLAKVIGKMDDNMLTDNVKSLGFELKWMDIGEAIKRMRQALKVCEDYKLRFVILRDQIILEYVMKR